MNQREEQTIRRIFFWSLLIKGFDSVIEIIGGFLFLATGSVTAIISHYVNTELLEDPTDFIATHLNNLLPYVSSNSQLFIAIYLLAHGIIKIFIIWNLLRRKLWAYPIAIWAFSLFIVYQLYRLIAHGFSLILILLTIFDLFILYLTYHEYQLISSARPLPKT